MKVFLAVLMAVLSGPALWADGQMQRMIVTCKPGTILAECQSAVDSLHMARVGNIASADRDHTFTAVIADVDASKPPQAMGLTDMFNNSNGNILSFEKDYHRKWIEALPDFDSTEGASVQNLGLWNFSPSQQAGSIHEAAFSPRIPWNIQAVGAPAAWHYTEGDNVNVGIIDTGIDFTHPDLAGRNKVVGGCNAVTGGCNIGIDATVEDPSSYMDDNGHGTHVAGIIAADGDGLVGVAPHARLYAIKVLDAGGSGNLSDVIKGIIWAADHGMRVVNMSLGSDEPSDVMKAALAYAESENVIIVAAAGNAEGGPVSYPGAYSGDQTVSKDGMLIAVAASDDDKHLASFSSVGPQVTFIAPGADIKSSYPLSKCSDPTNCYRSMSGTSMAAPHVTGLAVLAVAEGYTGFGGEDGVLAQLKRAASPLPGIPRIESGKPVPADNSQGYGLINAGSIVRDDSGVTSL